MTKIAIAFLAWIICLLAQPANLSGVPRVFDGDTLAIGATKVRLEGVDAPETDRVCLNANGVRWTCGERVQDRPSRNYSRAHAAVAEERVCRCITVGPSLRVDWKPRLRNGVAAGMVAFWRLEVVETDMASRGGNELRHLLAGA